MNARTTAWKQCEDFIPNAERWHTRLNTILLIALHMSRLLHPSFFSQVHIVNTHVFSIRARFHIHFKDISNTAKLYIHNICLWQEWYDMMDQKEMTYINVV